MRYALRTLVRNADEFVFHLFIYSPTALTACIAALRQPGYIHTEAIGRVLAQGDALEHITLYA